ncbi:MAG: ribosome biogenesis GTPase Der [Rhodospirillaceae bacterium]|nr:MAG: ribosome biogenesis GTPase Der [Rhodospirillaceae bacterium]
MKTVAIVGRPNVGKSTLFNRLVRSHLALTHDTPGVTRDWHEGSAELGTLRYRVIDTAGFDEGTRKELEMKMRAQTEGVLDHVDVALFLIDAREGLTPIDEHFAKWLRKRSTPVLLVANKCEGKAGDIGYYGAFQLGFGEPIAISAEHNVGMADLYEAMLPFIEPDKDDLAGQELEKTDVLSVAIVGRPNVGKSTLANRLIGEERLLTGPEAGVTRDAIPVTWEHDGRTFSLVDTAGFRRQARVEEKLEQLSVGSTKKAIYRAHVAMLVLDAENMMEKQDLTIADLVIEEGRALVIVVNKWDRVRNPKAAKTRLLERMERSLPQVRGLPTVMLSAKTGENLDKLMPTILKAYEIWNRRVSTAKLNQWLEQVVERHSPPAVRGRPLRLRYLTQIKSRPPTFALFVSRPEKLPESYIRYLVNDLRETFGFGGTPVRFRLRKGKNPYDS